MGEVKTPAQKRSKEMAEKQSKEKKKSHFCLLQRGAMSGHINPLSISVLERTRYSRLIAADVVKPPQN